MKKVTLLSASGSIGTQILDTIKYHSSKFETIGLSVGYNMKKLAEILDAPPKVCQVRMAQEADMEDMQKRCPSHSLCLGDAGLKQSVANPGHDVLVNVVVGFRRLISTLAVIEYDKTVTLANKKSLIVGGPLVKRVLKEHPIALCPIDSKHPAIFQCLQGNALKEVDKLIITVNGGSFHDRSRTELVDVTVEEVLQHPNWDMGGCITIDSATMMNKGFEVIEAHYLSDIPYDAINVMIHRGGIIRSMVQHYDHTVMAQLGTADMRLPIQYALSYPSCLEMKNAGPLDSQRTFALYLMPVNEECYPLLKLAFAVGRIEGNLGAVMNGADEEAVVLFLDGRTGFLDIERYIIKAVETAVYIAHPSLEEVIESDAWTREFVHRVWRGGIRAVWAIQ